MHDPTDQLREWSKALAQAVEPADIERIKSPVALTDTANNNRRWLAVAASVLVIAAGIFAVATLGNDDPDQIIPATNPPRTSVGDTTAATPTTTPSTDAPSPREAPIATGTPTTTEAPTTTVPPTSTDAPTTTVPPTSTDAPTTTDATEPPSAAVVGALDFNRDEEPGSQPSVFGYSALTEVDDAALVDDVSEVLGDADADTGWIPMPDAYACTGASQYRSLLWDDIRFVLAQSSGGPEITYLAAWSIGETALAYSPPLDAEIPEPSGITTTDGIGLGTPVDQLEDVGWDQFYRDADQFFGLAGIGPVVFELDAADQVVAMSYEQNDC